MSTPPNQDKFHEAEQVAAREFMRLRPGFRPSAEAASGLRDICAALGFPRPYTAEHFCQAFDGLAEPAQPAPSAKGESQFEPRAAEQPSKPSRPTPPPLPTAKQVPPELLNIRNRWVCWNYVWNDKQQKWTKPPFSPVTGEQIGAKVKEGGEDWTKHWTDFATARIGALRFKLDGVGVVFVKADGLLGTDLDNCRDPQTGTVHPTVAAWLEGVSQQAYVEASPSLTGVHVIGRARLPGPGNKKPYPGAPNIKVEMYDDGRFFTFTGVPLFSEKTVGDYQAHADILHRFVFGAAPADSPSQPAATGAARRVLSNGAIIKRITEMQKWRDIFNKNVPPTEFVKKHHAGDDSAADMAFCTLAARLTTDPAQIAELWQASSLWREKAEKRADYRDMTITRALAKHQSRRTDTRERRDVAWAWESYLPLGKLSLIDGDPGLAKSMLTLRLAVSFMAGKPLPDGSLPTVTGSVLLLSAEDDPYDTINPRLVAAGATDGPIPLVHHGVLKDDGTLLSLASPYDLAELELKIMRMGARLVIIDPLNAYLGDKVDSHNDQKIRQVLGPLSEIANRTGAVVLAIRHARKSGGAKAIHVGLGSIGYTAAARVNFFVAEHPEERDAFLFTVSKSNLGPKPPSLKYRIETVAVAGMAKPVPYVTGFERSDLTANDAAAAQAEEAEGGGKLGEAIEFVKKVLQHGAVASTKLEKAARAEGISERTLRRAKKSLNVTSGQKGGGWACWLPEERLPFSEKGDTEEPVPF